MPDKTRLHYQEELEQLETAGARAASTWWSARSTAPSRPSSTRTSSSRELVVADDDRIDGRYLEVNQEILTLLATQAPVATDLRLISALLHVMNSIERMGDQCVNICKLIPLTGHDAPQRPEMLDRILRWASRRAR